MSLYFIEHRGRRLRLQEVGANWNGGLALLTQDLNDPLCLALTQNSMKIPILSFSRMIMDCYPSPLLCQSGTNRCANARISSCDQCDFILDARIDHYFFAKCKGMARRLGLTLNTGRPLGVGSAVDSVCVPCPKIFWRTQNVNAAARS